MARKPTSTPGPWLLIQEFPSYADAKAAQELIAGLISEPTLLRPKQPHPSDGNIATWRSTEILRRELGSRSFGWEEVEQILLLHGYAGSYRTWISAARRHGVIEHIARATYRFLSATRANPSDMPCATLAPR